MIVYVVTQFNDSVDGYELVSVYADEAMAKKFCDDVNKDAGFLKARYDEKLLLGWP